MERREFLRVSGLSGGALLFSLYLPASPSNSEQKSFTPNFFIQLDKDGSVTFNLTKHEMGQGSGTGLPMILADEMDLDWEQVNIAQPDYHPKYGKHMGDTGGSDSIISMWETLRKAGASARNILLRAAAQKWKAYVKDCFSHKGTITHKPSGRSLLYQEVIDIAVTLDPLEEVELKNPGSFQYIGKPIRNVFNKKYITGNGDYTINVKVPGMVYAAIARCPVYNGKLIDFDDVLARKMHGVIDVFGISLNKSDSDTNNTYHVQDGVVVIANSTWTAFEARKQLKIEWDLGEHQHSSIESLRDKLVDVAGKEESAVYKRGDFSRFEKMEGYRTIQATYENAYQAHSLMEPLNATVNYQKDSCEAWISCQNPGEVVREMSIILQIPEDKITLHRRTCGGSFGRRLGDFAREAAFIAKRVKRPVKLTWSREDDVRHDHFHPFQHSIHKAMISPQNKVLGWSFKGIKTIDWLVGTHIWEIPYEFDHIQTEHAPTVPSIVKTGAWRSVATHPSSLGKECFIDEIAREIQYDPLDLRLDLLPAVRKYGNEDDVEFEWMKFQRKGYRSVLEEVKNSGIWRRKDLKKGVGQGFAIERLRRAFCAYIAEVEVIGNKVVVHNIHSFLNCGKVVNPNLAASQIEGSIIWSLTAVLYGGVEVENGHVLRSNFHDNKVLRIHETPNITVKFIESDEKPYSVGEPGVPPLAPAVLNAVFDATGRRYRSIPIDLDND